MKRALLAALALTVAAPAAAATKRYHLVPTGASLIDRQWYHKRINLWAARRILQENGLDPDGNPNFTVGVLDGGIWHAAGNGGSSTVEIDHLYRNKRVVNVPFTVSNVNGSAIATLPSIPNAGINVVVDQFPVVSLTGGGARTYTFSQAPDTSHFTVLRDDIVLTEGPTTVTVHDYAAALKFNLADVGRSGTVTYWEQLIVGAANLSGTSWDWAGNTSADLEDSMWAEKGIESCHGCGVSGLIAGQAPNGDGYMAGIVPHARFIYAATVANPYGFNGSDLPWSIPAGMRWLVKHGARVTSHSTMPSIAYNKTDAISLQGAPEYDRWAMWDASAWMRTQGTLPFIATANDNCYWDASTPFDPSETLQSCGNLPGSIPVTAIFPNDNRWSKSNTCRAFDTGGNYGPLTKLGSPGINLLDTWWSQVYPPGTTNPNYQWFGHTSGATPVAAGTAALGWGANPALSDTQIESLIMASRDPSYGDGVRFDGTTKTWASELPNAGILSAAKLVANVLTTLPANAHRIFPYVNFFKLPPYNGGGHDTEYDWATPDALLTTNVGDGPWNLTTAALDGTATTTLTGRLAIEAAGFSSDTVDRVVVTLGGAPSDTAPPAGGTTVYDGPPKVIYTTASYSAGTAQPLTITACVGATCTSETYSDVLVSTLSSSASTSAIRRASDGAALPMKRKIDNAVLPVKKR